jgi:hypothetical protein
MHFFILPIVKPFIAALKFLVEILELHMDMDVPLYILICASVASSMDKSCQVLAKNSIENYLVR